MKYITFKELREIVEGVYAPHRERQKECLGRFVGRQIQEARRKKKNSKRLDKDHPLDIHFVYNEKGVPWVDRFEQITGEPWAEWAKRWREKQ